MSLRRQGSGFALLVCAVFASPTAWAIEQEAMNESFARAFGLVVEAFRKAAAEREQRLENETAKPPAAYPYDRSAGAASNAFAEAMRNMAARIASGPTCLMEKLNPPPAAIVPKRDRYISLSEDDPFREFQSPADAGPVVGNQCATTR